MVAGGCPAEELERRWLNMQVMSRPRWQVPRSPLDGILEFGPLEALIREVHEAYPSQIDFGVVATDTLRLRPRLFRTPNVTWRHLAASVGMICIYRQYRIDGRIWSDGGLLGALPLWGAVEMGAERIVAVNCLPGLPSRLMTAGVRTVQLLAPYRRPPIPDSVGVRRNPARRAAGVVARIHGVDRRERPTVDRAGPGGRASLARQNMIYNACFIGTMRL